MRIHFFYPLLLAMPALTFNFSTYSNRNKNTAPPINVHTISQLYAAVNDPANAGKRIILAAGKYVLDSNQAINFGRLELQKDMALQGQQDHPEKVIIDESKLSVKSFVIAPFKTGGIRMGRGSNTIEWLTVIGDTSINALSAIDTDLPPTVTVGERVGIRIAHVIIKESQTGIDIRNPGFAGAGRIIEADIENNELTNNMVYFGQGITIQNANGSTASIIRANLEGNNVHGNKVGLRGFTNNANNTNSDFGSITIHSKNDHFDDNGVGIIIAAGVNQGTTTTANNNFLYFEAHGTTIKNNRGVLPPDLIPPPPCGMYVLGGFSVKGAVTSDNRLEISLSDCPFSGNKGSDIIGFGALSSSATNPAGNNNVVAIELRGISKSVTPVTTASSPAEPAGTNTINVFRN
jgi:hypothetical protein